MQIAKQQIKYIMDGVGAISPEQRAVGWEKMCSPTHFSAWCSTVFWYISGKPIYTHWYKHKPLCGCKGGEEWHWALIFPHQELILCRSQSFLHTLSKIKRKLGSIRKHWWHMYTLFWIHSTYICVYAVQTQNDMW